MDDKIVLSLDVPDFRAPITLTGWYLFHMCLALGLGPRQHRP